MQKTTGFHRLLAVLVSVLLAVCCLPTSVFADNGNVSPKIHVKYEMDGRNVKEEELWPGTVPYSSGQKVKYSWDTLYKKMNLPAETKVKNKQTGDCELDLSYKADLVFHGYLTVELEPHFWMDFTVRYVGPDGAELESRKVSLEYSPSTAQDAWKYVTGSAAFLRYKADLRELKIEPGDDKAYTEKDQLKVGPELKDKTLVAYLGKSQDPEVKTVNFQLRYLSTDNQIQDTQPATLTYGPDDERTDAWDFLLAQDAYKTYAAQDYVLADYVVTGAEGGDRLCDKRGLQQVTTDLEGKTVIVHLVKPAADQSEKVTFLLRYASTDGNIRDDKEVTVPYDPNGTTYDLWNYIENSGAFRSYKQEGYTLKSFVVPHDNGEKTYTEAGQFTVTPALAGKAVSVTLEKPPVVTAKTVNFQLRFLSTDNQIHETKDATLTYEPEGVLTDLWDFLLENQDYKTFAEAGYQLSDYVISREKGDLNGTARGIQAVTTDLEGKTVIVHLVKPAADQSQQVSFLLRYASTDGNIRDDKEVTVPYDPNGTTYDLWSYIENSGAFRSYKQEGYTLKSFVVPHESGEKTYTGAGQFTVTPALAGKAVSVTLEKPPVITAKTVNFQLRFLSTDNQIHETKDASLTYEPAGVLTDLWDFLLANGDYGRFAQQGYRLSDYVISREKGDLNGTARGIQAVTTDLEGKTVIVHLVKEAARAENVDFSLRFLSNDGKVDVTKAVSVPYDPNGKSYDAWNYLLGTGTFQSYAKAGYALKDLVVPQDAGNKAYTKAGEFTLTPALKGKTLVVHLDNTKTPARYESSYLVHFVDEKGKEFQSAVTVKVNWTEGQQLNLMAQLQEALKTVPAKGYTFKTLSAWNNSAAYKGTELVVPGSWELAAHCTKNAAPAKPQKPAETPKKPAAQAAKAKPAAQQVVKPAAPAANNTKILPKTGFQAQTPVLFGVMLAAALAGAAVYLFAVRKKLN